MHKHRLQRLRTPQSRQPLQTFTRKANFPLGVRWPPSGAGGGAMESSSVPCPLSSSEAIQRNVTSDANKNLASVHIRFLSIFAANHAKDRGAHTQVTGKTVRHFTSNKLRTSSPLHALRSKRMSARVGRFHNLGVSMFATHHEFHMLCHRTTMC
jgi:hypothetical protein